MNLDAITDSTVHDAVAEYLPYVDSSWGDIRIPGKFQGEQLWVVYFYEWMLNGEGEPHYFDCEHSTAEDYDGCDCESELDYTSFEIGSDDAAVFPELTSSVGKFVRLSVSGSGFVYGQIKDTES